MASKKDTKHIEIHKDVHKALHLIKVVSDYKSMTDVIQHLLDNQKK